ncbi:hypothetical protein PoB_000482000 [Plakobranchus ocellatus]|uniref:Uncharacterized protein n=1 Tax=Plakobranchus ocellatus TaxID=259542 RepID=A0AAV3Y6A5_9GAST|nr:hypothetical protein PoB_000482000 [Plakobranchus ocellatus]
MNPEDAVWDNKVKSDPATLSDDDGWRDEPRNGLRSRSVGEHSNLGKPRREDSEGAVQASSAGELYCKTNTVRAGDKRNRLPWRESSEMPHPPVASVRRKARISVVARYACQPVNWWIYPLARSFQLQSLGKLTTVQHPSVDRSTD